MLKMKKLTKAIAAFAAFAQLTCVAPVVMAENSDEATAAPAGVTSVYTWDEIKAQKDDGSFKNLTLDGTTNATVSYDKGNDCINMNMNKNENASFKVKDLNVSNGLITISYKLKGASNAGLHLGKLAFNGVNTWKNNTSYGYRDNNCLNYDYYNGSSMTNGWRDAIKLENYDWLDFEYKINLSEHKIAAKITDAKGDPVHSADLGLNPNETYLSGLSFGIQGADFSKVDNFVFSVKDLTITKTQTVVTNVSVTDGAENIAADTPVEITFSTDVVAEKVKNALTVNGGKDFDVTVNGSVATVKLSNPKSNKSYTLKLAEGADVGGYGTIPEEMSVTYKTAKATGITNVITWDKVKEQNTDGTFKNIKTYTHSKGTIAYNAADKCIDMTVNKGDKSLFTLDLNESNGLINISYKVKATKSAAGVLYGKLAFNGQTDYADEKTYGYRDSNCLNWDSYNADAGKNGNGWDENMKFENYDWLNFEYKIDLANHMVAAKITKADGNEVNSKNIKLNPSETYLSGIRFGMNNNTSDQDGVVVSVKDLNITTTNIIVTDSALDNTAAIDPTADIKLTFNAELTADDFKADVIDNVIVVKDSDGNTVNCTKTVAFSGKVVTISLSGLEGNKTYTLTIPEGSALAFGKLAEEYVGSFTTKAKAEIKGTYTFANKTVTVNGSASLPEEGGIGIIAVYNKADNSLIKVYTKSLDKSSEAQPIGTSVENVTANEVIVKGFVWNSLDSETGMRPIVDDAEFTAAQ